MMMRHRRCYLLLLSLAMSSCELSHCLSSINPEGEVWDPVAYARLAPGQIHRTYQPGEVLSFIVEESRTVGYPEDDLPPEVPWDVEISSDAGHTMNLERRCRELEEENCIFEGAVLPGRYHVRVNYENAFTPVPDLRCGEGQIQHEIYRRQRATVFVGVLPNELQYVELRQEEASGYVAIRFLGEFTESEPQLNIEIYKEGDQLLEGTTRVQTWTESGIIYWLYVGWSPAEPSDLSCDICTYHILLTGLISSVEPIDMRPFMWNGEAWSLTLAPEAYRFEDEETCKQWGAGDRVLYPDALPPSLQ